MFISNSSSSFSLHNLFSPGMKMKVSMKRERSVSDGECNQRFLGINEILPEEILFHHIFVRLSPKTLIFCKSVCKPWNSVISNPKFVKHHLIQQQNQNKYKLLVRALENRFYSVDYKGEGGLWSTFPAPANSRPGILDSCHGLVCMYVNRDVTDVCPPKAYKLYMWNPITRESKLVPDPDPYIRTREALGFGYDHTMDDYKIIRVIKTDRMDVYSLRNNSWNVVKRDNPELEYFRSGRNLIGVGVNRYLYWVRNHPDCKRMFDLLVVGLCLRDYRMTEIKMPDDLDELGDRTGICTTAGGWGITSIGSCLGLYNYEKPLNFVVWTLKENEGRKWEKMMTFSLSSPDIEWYGSFTPIWVTEEGKVVIFVGGRNLAQNYKLGLYDLQKKSIKYVPITGDENGFLCERMAHIQSLVSPNVF